MSGNATLCSSGSLEFRIGSSAIGQLGWNFGTNTNLPMPPCTSTRRTFIGPTIHYGGERWWASIGFLHQLPIGQAFSHDNQEFAADGGYIFGDEHEEYYVRLKLGFNCSV